MGLGLLSSLQVCTCGHSGVRRKSWVPWNLDGSSCLMPSKQVIGPICKDQQKMFSSSLRMPVQISCIFEQLQKQWMRVPSRLLHLLQRLESFGFTLSWKKMNNFKLHFPGRVIGKIGRHLTYGFPISYLNFFPRVLFP